MAIEFTRTDDPGGFEVFDTNERRQLQFKTAEPVSLEPADTSGFRFPVDEAVTFETTSLLLDQYYVPNIHDEDGVATQRVNAGESYEFESSTEFVGLNAPILIYCRVSDPGTLETGVTWVRLTFEEPAVVAIGARSLNERPVGTVRTPDDPEAMLSAVSALSSALKTTSPERTWPTQRGHPPLIESGSTLEIPDEIERTATDVTVEVPPTYANAYVVAPLAFFLGAAVRPGDTPAIVTDTGRFELGVGARLEDDVARALKRVFLLDSVVRTEGVIRATLHEREALENELPFDLSETYDEPQEVRLERYFEVPYSILEPHVPRWPLTAYVPPTPDGVEILPFVVNQLGIVREPRGDPVARDVVADAGTFEAPREAFVRSAATSRSPANGPTGDRSKFVEPTIVDDSVEHAWFGERMPLGTSKATIEAYRNKLSRRDRRGSIEILVVCNDARMLAEHDKLNETYGTRESLPLDVTSQFGVSTADLETLLTEGGYDFLHYIGHATESGLVCPDGELDVQSIPDVDVGVFFLNACRSYEQGLELVRRGAFGGIVTLSDVVNENAVEVGECVARLLDLGFPLRGALEIVRETNLLGPQYLIVGDGSVDIAQPNGPFPCIEIIELDGDTANYALRTYPGKDSNVGIAHKPALDHEGTYSLAPGETPHKEVPVSKIESQSFMTRTPLLVNGQLEWNDRFDVSKILQVE